MAKRSLLSRCPSYSADQKISSYAIKMHKRKALGDEEVLRSYLQKLFLRDLLKCCSFIHNYASQVVSFREIFHTKFRIAAPVV